jgi:hypothetical protein
MHVVAIAVVDVRTIEQMFVHHVEYSLAQSRTNLTEAGAFQGLEHWMNTVAHCTTHAPIDTCIWLIGSFAG